MPRRSTTGSCSPKKTLFSGGLYTRDSWHEYWEGTLKRDNDNIGTVTTEINTWYANYGLIDRVNLIAAVPYVWTVPAWVCCMGSTGCRTSRWPRSSTASSGRRRAPGSVRAIAVISAGIPLTDYNPELPPLSIGSASMRMSWRGTFHYRSNPGWFVTGSTAYTARSDVTLDRPYFFTDDEFVMSDQVEMPSVFDYILRPAT